MELIKVISGGQTGADQGGILAARSLNITTGGWSAKNWLTEVGPAPWLEKYGLQECPVEGYPARTKCNAKDSDLTIWFGEGDTAGFICTKKACEAAGKPLFVVEEGMTPSLLAEKLAKLLPKVINIAGNRESKSRGIHDRVFRFCKALFARMR